MRVPDASCGHCKQTIESALLARDGVRSASLDLDSKIVSVEHDSDVSANDLAAVVSSAGYSPAQVPA
jgi:copper chaperone